MFACIVNRKKLVLMGTVLLLLLLATSCYLAVGFIAGNSSSPVEVREQNRQTYATSTPVLPVVEDGSDFFTECRLSRDQKCSKRMELLEQISENPASSSQVRSQAQQELMQLSERASRESELEKMVIARGYKEAVVLLQPKSVTIILQASSLPPYEVEQLTELVAGETGIDPSKVYIIPKP